MHKLPEKATRYAASQWANIVLNQLNRLRSSDPFGFEGVVPPDWLFIGDVHLLLNAANHLKYVLEHQAAELDLPLMPRLVAEAVWRDRNFWEHPWSDRTAKHLLAYQQSFSQNLPSVVARDGTGQLIRVGSVNATELAAAVLAVLVALGEMPSASETPRSR